MFSDDRQYVQSVVCIYFLPMFNLHTHLTRPEQKLNFGEWTGHILATWQPLWTQSIACRAQCLELCPYFICVLTVQMNDSCHLGPATSGGWHQIHQRGDLQHRRVSLFVFLIFQIQNMLHVFSIVSICSCFPKSSLRLSSSLPLSLVFYFCVFHLCHRLFHTCVSFFIVCYSICLCFLSLAFSVGMTSAGSRD